VIWNPSLAAFHYSGPEAEHEVPLVLRRNPSVFCSVDIQ
jgi:hypothetical protein